MHPCPPRGEWDRRQCRVAPALVQMGRRKRDIRSYNVERGKLVGEKVYNFRSNREGREATRSVLLGSEPGEDRPKAAANSLPGSERPECRRKDRGGALASLPAEQHDPARNMEKPAFGIALAPALFRSREDEVLFL